jgi:NAD(P)H-dependent FMN reductase
MSVQIVALVGSLRAGSHNRQLAQAAMQHAPAGVSVRLFEELGGVPLYNEDDDTDGQVSPAAGRLREMVAAADGLLLVTPEHNGTMPAALKNAIDWLSRPFGASAISGKPVAVIGTAYGQYGGVWAHDEARKAAGIAGGNVLDVEVSIPNSVVRFAEQHPADDQEVVSQLRQAITDLAAAVPGSVSAAERVATDEGVFSARQHRSANEGDFL